MKYFLDTEFVEDGKTIDLISIGIITENGTPFYAISSEFDLQKAYANDFVRENVIPKLDSSDLWQPRNIIKYELTKFIYDTSEGGKDIEFWADYSSYDWVAFCQLFGTMMDLPEDFPMFCNDVQQFRKLVSPTNELLEFPHFLLPEKQHVAINDAIECKMRYECLMPYFQNLMD